ncbi:MAG: NAD-dependent epimerase/dehydratase family protein [Caldilineaceae bacterium]|nr:NAD-dependent epimerase/dehydratase family protein [Caldilineaceae bacterium]
MKILIIGGTGLISTAITRVLQQRGADVIHYNRGAADSQLAVAPPTIHGDRKEFAAFEGQMAEAGRFDCVIDMICFRPEEAESAVRAFRGRTDHFIFCSTVDVYTKPSPRYPITEDVERQPRPSFPYAYAKSQCERIFEEAHSRGDFPVTIIRPAYTYGEGRGLLHTFRGGMYNLQRIREGRPIIVHGDGTSLWASCHRDDVGVAFANAVGNSRVLGKAYHTASPEWLSWNQYHQQIAQAMDAPEPTLVHIPTDLLFAILPAEAEWCRENFQYNNIFDNRAAAEDLDFRYTIPWMEGVRRIVAWLDERGRITDVDEPPFYQMLLDRWQQIPAQIDL